VHPAERDRERRRAQPFDQIGMLGVELAGRSMIVGSFFSACSAIALASAGETCEACSGVIVGVAAPRRRCRRERGRGSRPPPTRDRRRRPSGRSG
jgi:hypothetical protein